MDKLNTLIDGAVNPIMPWIAVLLSIMVSIWFKEMASKIAKGWSFYRNPAFMPGDRVYLDDEPAVIISISIKETIFELTRDDYKIWRYVPNHIIDDVKLEKIIHK